MALIEKWITTDSLSGQEPTDSVDQGDELKKIMGGPCDRCEKPVPPLSPDDQRRVRKLMRELEAEDDDEFIGVGRLCAACAWHGIYLC